MIECYGGSRPQVERSTNEDAFVIGRDPMLYAAVCDGAWTPLGGTYKLQKAVAKAATHHFSEVPQAILDAAARTGRYDDMTVAALRIR